MKYQDMYGNLIDLNNKKDVALIIQEIFNNADSFYSCRNACENLSVIVREAFENRINELEEEVKITGRSKTGVK